MSKEGAQLWLEDCQQKYKGVAGSNVLFDVPDETLYINPEGNLQPFYCTFLFRIIRLYFKFRNSHGDRVFITEFMLYGS